MNLSTPPQCSPRTHKIISPTLSTPIKKLFPNHQIFIYQCVSKLKNELTSSFSSRSLCSSPCPLIIKGNNMVDNTCMLYLKLQPTFDITLNSRSWNYHKWTGILNSVDNWYGDLSGERVKTCHTWCLQSALHKTLSVMLCANSIDSFKIIHQTIVLTAEYWYSKKRWTPNKRCNILELYTMYTHHIHRKQFTLERYKSLAEQGKK